MEVQNLVKGTKYAIAYLGEGSALPYTGPGVFTGNVDVELGCEFVIQDSNQTQGWFPVESVIGELK